MLHSREVARCDAYAARVRRCLSAYPLSACRASATLGWLLLRGNTVYFHKICMSAQRKPNACSFYATFIQLHTYIRRRLLPNTQTNKFLHAALVANTSRVPYNSRPAPRDADAPRMPCNTIGIDPPTRLLNPQALDNTCPRARPRRGWFSGPRGLPRRSLACCRSSRPPPGNGAWRCLLSP